MRKGFKEMWWRARLCARVLKRLFVAFARLAAMCKGFKGNAQPLPLCEGLYGNVTPCVAMCKAFKRKYSSLTIMRKGFIEM